VEGRGGVVWRQRTAPLLFVIPGCELLAPAEATVFRRIIEYPSQGCYGARSAYSRW
jgi:hypothetical protein